jgi:hypothetical protein
MWLAKREEGEKRKRNGKNRQVAGRAWATEVGTSEHAKVT